MLSQEYKAAEYQTVKARGFQGAVYEESNV